MLASNIISIVTIRRYIQFKMGEDSFILVKRVLELLNECEENNKVEAFKLLERLLNRQDTRLVALGYDRLIFKELIKMVRFEGDNILKISLEMLKNHFFPHQEYLDEIVETLIHRSARSNDREICRLCFEKISTLIDAFDDSLAKHSKQLQKLADINEITDLNPLLSEILSKLEQKLPKRKSIE